jgi:sugar lactone lactonase YvrE
VRYKRTLFVLLVAFGALCAAAAPALAAERHFFAAGFGSFGSPVGVAVNESTQHVYVTDMASAAVDNFEASGAADPTTPQLTGVAFVQPYGVAVDNSGGSAEGYIYVADLGAGAVDQFDQAGASTGSQITVADVPAEGTAQAGGLAAVVNNGAFSPAGVAVDSSGHVFVADTSNNVVDEFSSSGVFVAQLGAGLISGVQLIAVNSAGDLYVATNATGTVELDAAGSCVEVACAPLDAAGTVGIAVDGAGNVYASEGSQIAKYDAAGTLVERFGTPTAFPAFGGLASAYGIGIDDVTHAVYIADPGAAAGDIFNLLTVPDLTSEPPSEVRPTTAILKGTVNAAGSTVSACQFEWGTEPGVYPNVLPCTEPVLPLTGSTTVGASAEVSGLEPGHVYHYRLSITNENATVYSEDESFSAEAVAPTIAEESVTEDSATGVRLNAEIDPGGAETTYHFEYDTVPYEEGEAAHGKSTPETALFASDNGEHRATAILQDLQPGTVYHYRVVASNPQSGGGIHGRDQTFTTHSAGAVFALPDARVWEQVSPVNKEGAEITTADLGYGGDMQASENGQAVTYVASAPLGTGTGTGTEGQSSPIENQVLSTRAESGAWSSQNLDTPHNYASAIENGEALEPDFIALDEYQVFSPDLSLAYVEPEGHTQLGSTPVVKDGKDERETYVRDNSTGVFTATTSSANEWYAEQVARAQGPPSCDASTAPDHEAEVDAISQDGCYVYFNSEEGSGQLYVAHDEGGNWTTTPLPALNGQVRWHFAKESGGEPGYRFDPGEELSPDGRYLAFMSNASLTGYDNVDVSEQPPTKEEEEEKEEHGENPKTKVSHHDEEVFEYDAETNRLVCASCDPTGARPVGVREPGIQGIGSFIAPLMVDRNSQWRGYWLAGILPDWTEKGEREPIYQPRYISNSGRLLFNSPEALVPADVNGLQDVYEYEPAVRPGGGIGSEGAPPGDTCITGSSSDGSTYEPAQSFDAEGREGESGPGCVALISSGTSRQESAFVDASASGGDVFFLTSARLAAQDDDNAYDVYDAHICGAEGVPCAPVGAVPPPPCDTEASCKAAPSPQPEIFGAPASSTFTGAGNLGGRELNPSTNVAPKKKAGPICKKGFVRNDKGKCVRRKAKRAKRANTKRRAHR